LVLKKSFTNFFKAIILGWKFCPLLIKNRIQKDAYHLWVNKELKDKQERIRYDKV